ncbi:ribosome hibernation-promoting factor, HPF/YfiA family [Sphingomonas sp. LaA6.9]|uniref:ribosome hibernation-promoting factor, HPF/YfiA family n=1 Tax=Sphingomonas sp. LaA6.9 TaxID=2919914 RepID=UPI001F4F7A57|nr:ribosome-associated translation inhibitor RaiA [Sphingomonas sp. LaA6.9]MCJ8159219.1 ribosome-associated translation inhibitor RaiA [Sphingomonas sp. LaA6.9]
MDIRVSGHQVDTGDALKAHVSERLNAIADKYFSRALSAQVTFGKGPHDYGFRCDIVAHVMQGVILKGSATGQEAHPAFEGAADRVETQLRRYKRRLKDRAAVQQAAANAELLQLNGEAGYTVFTELEGEDDVGEHPPIIAETRVDVPDASVSDAVMMLDLRNTNALLFKNSGTGAYNMVYRRGDGTIGWVEPQRAAS